MKIMKKLLNIALIALIGTSAVGCYNDFGTPEPAYVYTDADFEGSSLISIKELKEHYSHLVLADCDSSTDYNDSEVIVDDLVISGKVISSDESGNVYKSLFIQDGSFEDGTRAAIELRLFASNYTKYPIGSTVYVKLQGLSIGDYRGMLSIGAFSVSSWEQYCAGDTSVIDYIHTTIETRTMLNEHIFLGESGEITEDDIIEVDATTYQDILYTYDSSDPNNSEANYLACLIRFKGLTSAFTENGDIAWPAYADTYYPSYYSYFDDNDGSFDWSSSLGDVDSYWADARLAYKGTNPATQNSVSNYYYGSSWFTYDRESTYCLPQFVVRVSGYAKFRETVVPADGEVVDITAIFTQYHSSTGGYRTFQLVLNSDSDIEY